MRKYVCKHEKEPRRQIKKTRTTSRLAMIGLTITMTLGIANCSYADESAGGNREKIAEMTALARHNERCPAEPSAWSTAYLMLLMMAPPTEAQVAAKEREMLALSGKVGNKKWCQLYAAEMEQAYIIYRLATQH